MSIRWPLFATAILLGIFGCSQTNIPTQPTLLLDLQTIGCWGPGACSALPDGGLFTANFIGTAPQQAVQLQNKSSADITVTAITQTGDSAFTYTISVGGDAGTTPFTIGGLKTAFLDVIFTPTQAKTYNGSLTLASNAVQSTFEKKQTCGPSCAITLTGMGVEPPPPILSFITPSGGPAGGGTSVTLGGANFLPNATVDFGGVMQTNVTVSTCDTSQGCQESITCNTPPHAAGTANVMVVNPNGATSFDAGSAPVTFTYCTVQADGGCS